MFTLSHSGNKAKIATQGAELHSFKNASGTEFIWNADPAFWGKHAPVLFPIVGTLKHNKFEYEGHSYAMGRHGFARDLAFVGEQLSANQASFVLRYTADTLLVYPFKFDLRITYLLNQDTLSISYQVQNLGDKEMPFSMGAHPAFALPGLFTNYALQFNNDHRLNYFVLQNDLLSTNTKELQLPQGLLELNYALFANDALVFKKLESDCITLLKNKKPFISIAFQGFPNLGLWTKLGAPFLCIEPWHGYADTVNADGILCNKEGITILEPRGNFETIMRISIL